MNEAQVIAELAAKMGMSDVMQLVTAYADERVLAVHGRATRESVFAADEAVREALAIMQAKLEQAHQKHKELADRFWKSEALSKQAQADAARLWMLLDDVDTADDIAKADPQSYRALCRKAHAKRWEILAGEQVDAALAAMKEQE
jgi:hypothetical protein